MSEYIVVLITVPSAEVGQQVANHLLEQKLVACVNMVPGVRSLYVWAGAVQDDAELLLVAKTKAALFESQLVPAVEAVHPYDVPEVIALPILLGSKAYLAWIEEEVIVRDKAVPKK